MAKKDYEEIVIEWLEAAMDAGNVSQSELGRRMKSLDQPKISKIVRQERELSAAEMLEAANALNVDLPNTDKRHGPIIYDEAIEEPATQEDLSEISLSIVKEVKLTKFHDDITDEEYLEATAIIFAALMQTGRWNPRVYAAASDLVSKIGNEREVGKYSFKEYIKSVAICYVKMVGARSFFQDAPIA